MRLSGATLGRLDPAVARVSYDRQQQQCGIVHLGLGAFHRAHQAAYTDAAMAAGDRDWAITGVSMRSGHVVEQLEPQDGLFTITEQSASGAPSRLVGSVTRTLTAPHSPAEVAAALASPSVRLVTLTVTEKAYFRGAGGSPDSEMAAQAEGTIYHHLSRAVVDRFEAKLDPLTLLSCDNLTSNGAILRDGLAAFLDRLGGDYRRWFEADWAIPSTMVDRIVPATTISDLDRVETAIGLRDEGAVITEPFSQWVIEDRFAGSRPRWEVAGAQFVSDVAPFEHAKLRMLNGAHSALAYLGLAAGHAYVHQAVASPSIRRLIERLVRDEAAPSLATDAAGDLALYADRLFERFANPALPHALAQIASDGSEKIGPRWLDALLINRAASRDTPATLNALAAWILFVRRPPPGIHDPLDEPLAALWSQTGTEGIVDALFGCDGLFAGRWPLDPETRRTLLALVIERGLADG